MGNLTQERLKELLDYDQDTGIFRWRVNRGGKAGDIAGSIRTNRYRRIMVDGKLYQSSRLVWLFMEGYFPEHECDHENRIKDDDRWDNIRHVSSQCNNRNRGRSKNNTSGVTGISWHKTCEKWHAQIEINYKHKHLGYFKEFKDAITARWDAEVEHDWPGCNSHTDAYCYLNQP